MRARSGWNGMKPKQARSGSFVFSLGSCCLGSRGREGQYWGEPDGIWHDGPGERSGGQVRPTSWKSINRVFDDDGS